MLKLNLDTKFKVLIVFITIKRYPVFGSETGNGNIYFVTSKRAQTFQLEEKIGFHKNILLELRTIKKA